MAGIDLVAETTVSAEAAESTEAEEESFKLDILCSSGHIVDKRKDGLKAHQILERHYCAVCADYIPANATRYRCRERCNFDVCEKCYSDKGGRFEYYSQGGLVSWAARSAGGSYEFGDLFLKDFVRCLSGIRAESCDDADPGSEEAAPQEDRAESIAEQIRADVRECISKLEAGVPVLKATQEELEVRHEKELATLDRLGSALQVDASAPDAAELKLLKQLRGTPKMFPAAHERYARLLAEVKGSVETFNISASTVAEAEKAGQLNTLLEPLRRATRAAASCEKLVCQCGAFAQDEAPAADGS